MTRKKLKVAIVGCGHVASYGHVPAIMQSNSLQCVAYVDLDINKAASFSKKFGEAQTYTDYKKMLQREDIDIVAILTLPSEHAKISIDAINAGKHVFTEKPISSDVENAEKMISIARKMNKKLFVGFLLRYTGVYKKMGEIIRSGEIGTPVVHQKTGYERYESDEHFFWNRSLDFIRNTSCGFDCGSHYVDLMRWFSQTNATSVTGIGARINKDTPEGMFDWENYQIEFEDGSRGVYGTGWGYSFPKNKGIHIAIGPKGYVGVRMAETEEGKESGAEVYFCKNGKEEKVIDKSPWKGFEEEWEFFVNMINNNLDPYFLLNEAMASLKIVVACHQSALAGGKSIKLSKQ